MGEIEGFYRVIASSKFEEFIKSFPEYSVQEILYAVCKRAGVRCNDILKISDIEIYRAIELTIKEERED